MAPRHFSLLICLVALLLAPDLASADRRVALVIGNSNYENTPALTNAVNDAEDMAAALQRVGFTVVFERNGTKRAIEQAIVKFARLARDSEAALFYYAGHGLQYRGQNFLMPVDAKLEDDLSLNFEMTRLDDVLQGLDQSPGVRILILDACRNNPLSDRLVRRATTRDLASTRGLARIDRSQGMVVAYATQANEVAADGKGRNSPFTAALVRRIGEPDLEIGTMFRRVAADVYRVTGGRQQPELSVSLLGEFYFMRGETDVTAWVKVRATQEPSLLRDFIFRHSSSPLVVDARERLAALERDDTLRLAREKLLREQAEREMLAKRMEELDRIEQAAREQRAREQVIREQLAREQAARERLAQEQAARERLAQEQAVRGRLAQEQAARERLAQEQATRERLAQEQTARERLAQEQAARERLAQEQAARVQTALLTQPVEKPTQPPPAVLAGEALVKAIQNELKRVGCFAGTPNGDWAAAQTKASVKRFTSYAALSGAIDPTPEFLDMIRNQTGRICPLQCAPRQVERDGACVAKQCPAGSRLNAKGACEDRVKTASHPPSNAPATTAPSGPKAKPQGKATREQCFNAVRGRQFYKQAFGAAVRRCMHGGISAI